jgi:hypothetical protein
MGTGNPSQSVGEARTRYFEQAGFPPDGGYAASFVSLGKLGPIPLGFPNTNSRRRAVVMHDLHHVATGYNTDWAGEGEISAWEIAAGCGRYAFAWFINLQGMVLGFMVSPGRTWRAWVRGRHSKSLYNQGGYSDAVLRETVGSLRARLDLDRPAPPPTLADRLSYAFWCGVAALHAVLVLGIPLAAAALIWRLVT